MLRKKIIILLLVSFFNNYSYAQINVRDSLKQLLQTEKTDTGHALLLARLSFYYVESKPDTAMKLALQALEISRRIDYEYGEAASLNGIVDILH